MLSRVFKKVMHLVCSNIRVPLDGGKALPNIYGHENNMK